MESPSVKQRLCSATHFQLPSPTLIIPILKNALSILARLIAGNCSWYRTRSEKIEFGLLALGSRIAPNGKAMKKQTKRKPPTDKDTMRPEYDFSKGVRGKHAAKYAEGTNVVVLEPDVAQEFQTTEQVNETLRAVSKLLQQQRKRAGRKTA
jgi:hypothetical protein